MLFRTTKKRDFKKGEHGPKCIRFGVRCNEEHLLHTSLMLTVVELLTLHQCARCVKNVIQLSLKWNKQVHLKPAACCHLLRLTHSSKNAGFEKF